MIIWKPVDRDSSMTRLWGQSLAMWYTLGTSLSLKLVGKRVPQIPSEGVDVEPSHCSYQLASRRRPLLNRDERSGTTAGRLAAPQPESAWSLICRAKSDPLACCSMPVLHRHPTHLSRIMFFAHSREPIWSTPSDGLGSMKR